MTVQVAWTGPPRRPCRGRGQDPGRRRPQGSSVKGARPSSGAADNPARARPAGPTAVAGAPARRVGRGLRGRSDRARAGGRREGRHVPASAGFEQRRVRAGRAGTALRERADTDPDADELWPASSFPLSRVMMAGSSRHRSSPDRCQLLVLTQYVAGQGYSSASSRSGTGRERPGR